MNKKEVQKRVLKNGKPLSLNLFTWDEKTKTFSSNEDFLVVDFSDISGYTFNTESDCTFKTGHNCTFKTESNCTFKTESGCAFKTGYDCTFNTGFGCTFKTESDCTFNTGVGCTFKTESGCTFKTRHNCTFKTWADCTFNTESDCTFNTWSDCTFKTWSGCTFKTESNCTFNAWYNCTFNTLSDCTFKTGSGCTFNTGFGCTFDTWSGCVILRNDTNEIITTTNNIKLCPYNIKGYIELIKDKWYLNGDKSLGEHIIQDGILSKVIHKRGNVYKVINHDNKKPSYLITDGENWAHGKTLKEAKDSLIYKISNRDKSQYKGMTEKTVYTFEEAIKMYRVITGACESGVRDFLETIKDKKEKYSVKEIIKLTIGQYGNQELVNFIKGEK